MDKERRHQDQRDPRVIGEFAYRMRKVRRGMIAILAVIAVTIVAILAGRMFMGEIAHMVTIFSLFAGVLIVFVVAAPLVNTNYRCPACGERPTVGDGVRFAPRIRECEECGAALE